MTTKRQLYVAAFLIDGACGAFVFSVGRLLAEESVGLPKGQFGNSEVGHMNIGAGRVLYQDLLRIDAACEDGSLGDIPTLVGFIHNFSLLSEDILVRI